MTLAGIVSQECCLNLPTPLRAASNSPQTACRVPKETQLPTQNTPLEVPKVTSKSHQSEPVSQLLHPRIVEAQSKGPQHGQSTPASLPEASLSFEMLKCC